MIVLEKIINQAKSYLRNKKLITLNLYKIVSYFKLIMIANNRSFLLIEKKPSLNKTIETKKTNFTKNKYQSKFANIGTPQQLMFMK